MEVAKHIGNQIRIRRKSLKIPQQELADYMGISRVQITNIEIGNCGTTLDNLWEICNALQCNAGDLFPPQNPVKTETATKEVTRMIPTKVIVTKRILPNNSKTKNT